MNRIRLLASCILLAAGCSTGNGGKQADSVGAAAKDSASHVAAPAAVTADDTSWVAEDSISLPKGAVKPALRALSAGSTFLDERMDSMNRVEVAVYLMSLGYNNGTNSSHKQHRDCKPSTAGCAAGTHTEVWLQPQRAMHLVERDKIPDEGLVVGRFFNIDGLVEKRYGLPDGKTYWLVDRDPNNPDRKTNLRSRFFKYTPAGRDPIEWVGQPAPFEQCQHEDVAGKTFARAAFKLCSGKKGPMNNHEPSWVDCAQGCCVAGATIDGG